MSESCHEMKEGEVLNSSSTEYPLYEAIIYGDKINCAKLSKRLSCAIKHLPLRVEFSFEYDTKKAVDKGITKDPSIILNGNIFIEGLAQAEDITMKFEKLINLN